MPEEAKSPSDEFAAAAERRRLLAAQLAQRPIEEVLGLAVASGAGGWFQDDGRRTLWFEFDRWRIPPGPVKDRTLSVESICSQEEFDSLRGRIAAYTVFRIRARVVEESVIGIPQAELVEFLGPDRSDPELNQAAIDLQKPVVIADYQFGKLTLIPSINWYMTKAKWPKEGWFRRSIDLKLDLSGPGRVDEALATARGLWGEPERWTERILDYAVQELLPLKNANWLDEDAGEAEVTPRKFRSRMKLKSITVRPDGSFDFWYADGGLFSGHWIQVGGDLAAGPTRADIPG